MRFTTRSGRSISFNPFNQEEIDAAKAQAPGEGIGPAVTAELIVKVRDGSITEAAQLPPEYRHLGRLIGLREVSAETAQAILANTTHSFSVQEH